MENEENYIIENEILTWEEEYDILRDRIEFGVVPYCFWEDQIGISNGTLKRFLQHKKLRKTTYFKIQNYINEDYNNDFLETRFDNWLEDNGIDVFNINCKKSVDN